MMEVDGDRRWMIENWEGELKHVYLMESRKGGRDGGMEERI